MLIKQIEIHSTKVVWAYIENGRRRVKRIEMIVFDVPFELNLEGWNGWDLCYA